MCGTIFRIPKQIVCSDECHTKYKESNDKNFHDEEYRNFIKNPQPFIQEKPIIETQNTGIHIVYKTVNHITNQYYIGVHHVQTQNDGYLGSGLRLVRSVKKYSKQFFTRFTLFEFNNHKDAYKKEKELVEKHISNPKCLNLCEGGKGGAHFKGRKHSIETRKIISEKSKKQPKRKQTLESIEKAKQTKFERYGASYCSEETRKKISDKALARWAEINGENRPKTIKYFDESIKDFNTFSEKMKFLWENNPQYRETHRKSMEKFKLNYDYQSIQHDLDNGLKPIEIRKKYSLSRNRLDYMFRTKYIIRKK